MLIRVSGGKAGIKEYLEEGIKNGRDYSRDELDERVVLDGDLELTNDIIKTMETEGEKYLHVTLSFKEDHIDESTLNAVTQEFKAFAMKAYQDNEYTFYAEAHLPKIKSYVDKSTGETVERKPHIHVVIPEKNLVTGKRLEPLGLVKNNEHFIDAFQEITNEKHQLASPKHHVRTTFTDESSIISRHKADLFPAQQRDVKSKALEVLLSDNITTTTVFAQKLEANGFDVKTRNQGKDNEYLNIRSPNQKRGVNLKDNVFQTEFIALPKADKLKLLDSQYNPYRENGDSRYQASEKHHHDLQHWNQTRAFELRYVNRRNRQMYKSLSLEQKQQYLIEKRNEHGQSRVSATSIDDISQSIGAATKHLLNAERNRRHIKSGVRNLTHRRAIRTVVANLQRHSRDQSPVIVKRDSSDRLSQIQYDLHTQTLPSVKHIKQHIDALQLLHAVSKSHGIELDKYPISKGKDGGDRVQCGKRHLNVSDFLTKEMHFSWSDAKQYLEDQYLEQQGIDPKQAIKTTPEPNLIQAAWRSQLHQEREQRQTYLANYRLEKAAIYQDKSLSKADRNIALSITQMNKVIQDLQFKKESREAREQLVLHAQTPQTKDHLMKQEVGVIVSHKAAPYQHNEKNNMSYVVEIENHGVVREVWGKDLERVMKENAVQKGDKVKLTQEGQQDVTVNARVEQQDGTVKTEAIETHRNEWRVDKATDAEIKQHGIKHGIKQFYNEVEAATKQHQEYQQNKQSTSITVLMQAEATAEALAVKAVDLGVKDNPFNDQPKLKKAFEKGKLDYLEHLNPTQKGKAKNINNVKPESKMNAAFLDKNLEASRLLIHFPKLKELGINAESITKTEKGDKIQLGEKQLSVTQLIKETHNLKPKEVITQLTPIYQTQEKDKERVIEYKNNYMNNERKSLSELEEKENSSSKSQQYRGIEHTLLPSHEPEREREVFKPKQNQFGENITHDTNKLGHVTYYEGKEKLVTDRGNNVLIEQQSNKAVEIGLRLAMEKYGNHLDIKGTKEYQQQVVDIAVTNKLNISFKDKALNEMLIAKKAQFEKGENLISKAETAHKTQSKQAEQGQQKAQTVKQPAKPTKGWDR
ncbi:relaxase [Vibrio parahaemolyticus]|nr:relaxase [Vibrio parahaemolyticus]